MSENMNYYPSQENYIKIKIEVESDDEKSNTNEIKPTNMTEQILNFKSEPFTDIDIGEKVSQAYGSNQTYKLINNGIKIKKEPITEDMDSENMNLAETNSTLNLTNVKKESNSDVKIGQDGNIITKDDEKQLLDFSVIKQKPNGDEQITNSGLKNVKKTEKHTSNFSLKLKYNPALSSYNKTVHSSSDPRLNQNQLIVEKYMPWKLIPIDLEPLKSRKSLESLMSPKPLVNSPIRVHIGQGRIREFKQSKRRRYRRNISKKKSFNLPVPEGYIRRVQERQRRRNNYPLALNQAPPALSSYQILLQQYKSCRFNK